MQSVDLIDILQIKVEPVNIVPKRPHFFRELFIPLPRTRGSNHRGFRFGQSRRNAAAKQRAGPRSNEGDAAGQ